MLGTFDYVIFLLIAVILIVYFVGLGLGWWKFTNHNIRGSTPTTETSAASHSD